MNEDKLTHDERLRLECLAQAIALNVGIIPNPERITSIARIFESYVLGR